VPSEFSDENRRLPWQKLGAISACILLALGLAFLAGRQSGPTRVEEKVRVEKVEVEKVVIQEKVRVETVTVEKKVEVVRRVFIEKVSPDGTIERKATEDLATATDRSEQLEAEAEAWAAREAAKHSLEASSRVQERDDPRWLLGLVGGASLSLARQPEALGGIQGGVRLGPLWLTGQLQTNAKDRLDLLAGVAVRF